MVDFKDFLMNSVICLHLYEDEGGGDDLKNAEFQQTSQQ
jgi:hypothetical protein